METKELTNFFPLHRNIFNHRLWIEKRSFSKFEAWLDLLQTARFEDNPGSILIGGKMMKFNRGQIVASYRFLSVRWGWSTKKVGNYLVLLSEEGMICKETPKEMGQSLITICKYDDYNISSDERKRRKNTKETEKKQIENKSNKDNKENKKERHPVAPSVSEVTNYFEEKGYQKDIAIKAFEFYNSNHWIDSKGNQVKNWKMKMQSVWFKVEHKVKETKVPPGFSNGMVF